MPRYNPGSASGFGNTDAAQTWTGLQTFANFIVVNGVKIRPVITISGTDVIVAWEFEVDGVWKEQSSRKNQP